MTSAADVSTAVAMWLLQLLLPLPMMMATAAVAIDIIVNNCSHSVAAAPFAANAVDEEMRQGVRGRVNAAATQLKH